MIVFRKNRAQAGSAVVAPYRVIPGDAHADDRLPVFPACHHTLRIIGAAS